MDILSLITEAQRFDFAANYNYQMGFMGEKLFPSEKTRDLKVRVRQLQEGGNLPVMAQVHAFDTEARIGDRPDFNEAVFEKLFIKEKLPTSERVMEYFGTRPERDAVIDFIFDDYNSLLSRVLTRAEVARMEILATGKATYKENEVNTTVDYGVPSGNLFNGATDTLFKDWDDASADIIGALNKVKQTAAKKGYKVVRAITSETILGYMQTNTAIKNYFKDANIIMTEETLKSFIKAKFGIEFITNDDRYKVGAKDTKARRFFPEMTISFITTMGTVGASLYGSTPEELAYKGEISKKMYCTITSWTDNDPVITWTKASGLFVPVLKDPNSLFIATITT